MKVLTHSDQQEDGDFNHYVVFGNKAPWNTPESNMLQCESEKSSHSLATLINGNQKGINMTKHQEQQTDGSFYNYIVFGNEPPCDALPENMFLCNDEGSADRLLKLITQEGKTQ